MSMTTYEVTAPEGVRIGSGTLRLTPQQAEPRAHLLADAGKGVYAILQPVFFKRGEVFGYDGALPKALTSALEEPEKKAKPARQQAKPAGDNGEQAPPAA